MASAAYSRAASVLHWVSAPAMIGSIGCVLQAQNVKGKEKGVWMHRHKSLGLLSGMIMIPRVATKLSSRAVESLAGSSAGEVVAAKASHLAMYAFGVIMPGEIMSANLAFMWYYYSDTRLHFAS